MVIECKWSQDAFDPAGMLAFRRSYPQGENVLVAADVKRASRRRIGGLEVRVVSLSQVAALVVEALSRSGRSSLTVPKGVT